jgi:hypothetical protein
VLLLCLHVAPMGLVSGRQLSPMGLLQLVLPGPQLLQLRLQYYTRDG